MEPRVVLLHSARVRTALILFLFLMLAVALIRCGPSPAERQAIHPFTPENESERSELRFELTQLVTQIDQELENINEDLQFAPKEKKPELLYSNRKIKRHQVKIKKALHELEVCPEADWDRVKESLIQLSADIRSSFGQLAFATPYFLDTEIGALIVEFG